MSGTSTASAAITSAAMRWHAGRSTTTQYHVIDRDCFMASNNREMKLEEWAKVDWSLRDCDIAELVGRSRERVRVVRMELGKRPSPMKSSHLSMAVRRSVDPKKRYTTRELAALWKMSVFSARARGQILGVWRPRKPHELKHVNHPWHLMNLDLPNLDLFHIWRIPGKKESVLVRIAEQRRAVGKRALWNRKKGHQPSDSAYLRAYRTEVRRAERLRASQARQR